MGRGCLETQGDAELVQAGIDVFASGHPLHDRSRPVTVAFGAQVDQCAIVGLQQVAGVDDRHTLGADNLPVRAVIEDGALEPGPLETAACDRDDTPLALRAGFAQLPHRRDKVHRKARQGFELERGRSVTGSLGKARANAKQQPKQSSAKVHHAASCTDRASGFVGCGPGDATRFAGGRAIGAFMSADILCYC
ncbi:hypothetical protein D3C76_1345150 [compost metagenome]